MRKTLASFTACLLLASASVAQEAPQLKADNIDEIISAMTLEEKVHFCIGTGMDGLSGTAPVIGSTRSMLPGTAGTSYPIPRLGIPAVILSDGPAGLRIDPIRDFDSKTYYCTHFPIGTALASSWNTELVKQVGQAIGEEVLEYGSDVLLAPAINIHRHPLCGRNFEYYSEDPVVAGEIGAAYIQGVQSKGVGTSVKHFAVNNQETNRNANDARVSQRALREIYLKPFEIAIKKGSPWTVMSSYNKVNGTYTSESTDLLTGILRNDWGYQGMVMTDWFGGKDAVAQMIAGNEMLQPGRPQQYDEIYNAVKSGKLDESILDRNVKRILELIVKCPHFKGYQHSDKPDLVAHAAITRSSATEGMILLKNENQALPFQSSVKNVAVYGYTSYDIIPGGTGSGNVNRAYTVSLIEGLRNTNYVVDPNILSKYLTYKNEEKKKNERSGSFDQLAMFSAPRPKELVPTAEELNKAVADNDIAVITLGRISGEFLDRNANDFNLAPEEQELIQKVCAAFQQANKKVVVVLNIGGVIETASWKNQPDAILCAWQAGQEGGNSIADILSGKQNPSGKLTMTFPLHVDDAYSSKNFPMNSPSINDMKAFMEQRKNRTTTDEKNFDYTNYEEDIYVGYRYFDSFNKEVSYPFGYGLSYTTFSYSDLNVLNNGTNYDVTFTVTNTGKCKGKEVAEVYVKAPKGKLNVPAQELKGFAKTRLLNPGESQEVTISIPVESLASYNEKATAWVTTSGTYTFKVGASSRDIKLEKAVKVKSYKQKTSDGLKPQEALNLLKP